MLLTESGKVVGKGDRMTVKHVGEKVLVQDDSIVRKVGAEKSNERVECFPGIRAHQLRRVMENRDLGYSLRCCCDSCGDKLHQKTYVVWL